MQSGDELGGRATWTRTHDWCTCVFIARENRWLPPAAGKEGTKGDAQRDASRLRRFNQQHLLNRSTLVTPARDGGVALHGHVEAEVEHFGVGFYAGAFGEPADGLVARLADMVAGDVFRD